MLTRTQALEGGANVTCISKVQFTYCLFTRLTILAATLQSIRVKRPICQQLSCKQETEAFGIASPAKQMGQKTDLHPRPSDLN